MRSFIAAIVLALTACASMGLQEAQTLPQKMAYAYGTQIAIRSASVSSLDAKTITSGDMLCIMDVDDKLALALNGARDLAEVGDVNSAEARLVAASKGLTALQAWMRGESQDVGCQKPEPDAVKDLTASLAIALLTESSVVSSIISDAKQEGRDLDASDWKRIMDRDALVTAQQQAALAKAQAEGR